MLSGSPQRLADAAPTLQHILSADVRSPLPFEASEIAPQTVLITTRDGTRLATELYMPPGDGPYPAIALRTPYGRGQLSTTLLEFARHGYVVVAQDCRGTGDSEPNDWDYYVYEREDSYDLVEWVSQQPWFDGFLAGCGGSYLAQTQWCMALHPRMSTIVPEVGGLGVACHTARLHMFLNAYARSVGKGERKLTISYEDLERSMLEETLAGGQFNEPLHQPFREALLQRYAALRALAPPRRKGWLWNYYCTLCAADRADLIRLALDVRHITNTDVENLSSLFGQHIAHDAHMFAFPRPDELCQAVQAPALMVTGWYDWGLNDALATWELLMRHASERVRSDSRLLITPAAHNTPGYREGQQAHPELSRSYRTAQIGQLLMQWFTQTRARTLDSWPRVIYYLMGANEWRAASQWPPAEARPKTFYLGANGTLSERVACTSAPDRYVYDPLHPTPTVGGSIVSSVYTPGSCDVSEVQSRSDVLTYTTEPLPTDLDVVGPICVTLYASSSAADTDFTARLSDVFPDGRAIQLQNGLLRARYRDGQPELLKPGYVYRLEIDLWATANRFRAGHCLRLDIASADFPRFERNINRGGEAGGPQAAVQTIYHDSERPSSLRLLALYPEH